MKNPAVDIKAVLKQYVADITSVVGLLKAEGLKRNSFDPWQKTLYKTGRLTESNIEYDFHGIGCWVKWKNKIIDFDFRGNEENTMFGIDPWFAAYYLQSLNFKNYHDLKLCYEVILCEIIEMSQNREVTKRDGVYIYSEDYKKLVDLRYYKRQWEETTGDSLTDSWGTSYFYLETDDLGYIQRQLQVFKNGQVLKYDTTYLEDKFGGLSEAALGEDFEPYQITKDEFEQRWTSSQYKQFPEIVISENCLWGQPRLENRRLAVGDIVSQIAINSTIYEALQDYEITLQQARQALHYCRTLQCVKDKPIKFCHNCTLRVQQEGEADGEEQDNWKRADRLFREYFA